MKSKLTILTAVSAALLFAGCSSTSTDQLGKGIDYHTDGASTNNSLEVPPDLTSIHSKNIYAIPNSNSALANQPKQSQQNTTTTNQISNVLPNVKDIQIERDGNQRWLLIKNKTAAELWPALKIFWQENGFIIKDEEPEIGFMETDWAENRAKLPNDGIRKLLESTGLGGIYSTPERDKFLIRIEKTNDGTEVYFSHRGLYETYTSNINSDTAWQPRPSDPNLEAVFLARFMISLGVKEDQAKTALQNNTVQTSIDSRAKIDGNKLILADSFERAWRRTGLALDRIGMIVVDKDRSKGVYFVNTAKDDVAQNSKESYFSKLAFWRSNTPKAPTKSPTKDKDISKYRVSLKKDNAEQTSLELLDNQGNTIDTKTGKTMLSRLQTELQ